MDNTISPKKEVLSGEIKEEIPSDLFDNRTKCGEVFSWPGGSITLICAFCNDEFDDILLFGDHLDGQDKCKFLTANDDHTGVGELPINDEHGQELDSVADVDEKEVKPIQRQRGKFTCLSCSQQYNTQRGLERHQSLSRCGSATNELPGGEPLRKSRRIEGGACGEQTRQEFQTEKLSDLVSQLSCDAAIDSVKNSKEEHRGDTPTHEECNEGIVRATSENGDKEEKLFPCNFCDRVYKNKRSLWRHMRKPHRGVDKESAGDHWFCSPCNRPLTSRRALQQHQKRHGADEKELRQPSTGSVYHCEICNTNFNKKSELQIHSDIHDALPAALQGNLDFLRCKYCNIQFPKCARVLEHESAHTEDRPYQCAYCKKGFATNVDRKLHIRSHASQDRYECPHCSKVFTNKTDVKRHIERHLNTRNYGCELCDKRFYRPFELTRHMRTHTKERPYVCEDCGATYPILAQLKDHQLRHTGVKNVKCEICGRLFYSKSVLKVHMPTHFDEQPFECNVCGRKFSRAKALHKHQKLHSDVKRYVCNICGKAYAQDSGLYAHKKTHGANVG